MKGSIALRQSILRTSISSSKKKPIVIKINRRIEKKDSLTSTKSTFVNKTFTNNLSPPISPIIRHKNSEHTKKYKVTFVLDEDKASTPVSSFNLSIKRNKVFNLKKSKTAHISTAPNSSLNLSKAVIKKKETNSFRKSNPFMIPQEDLLFNDYQKKSQKNNKIIKKDKTKKIRLDLNQQLLQKEVYKIKPTLMRDINQIRSKKDEYSIMGYQNRIIDIIRNDFSFESVDKLNRTFSRFRTNWSLRPNAFDLSKTNRHFIKEIEKDEEKIIKNINLRNKLYSLYLKRNLHLVSPNKKKRNILVDFPMLKFKKVSNKKI